MQNSQNKRTRRSVLLSLIGLALVTAVTVVPTQFQMEVSGEGKGLFNRTESHEPGLENYDIRTQKGQEIEDAFLKYRNETSKDAASIADIRDGFVRGEEDLRSRVPSLKVEYNEDIRTPEVITPDVWKGKIDRLTESSTVKRSEILRNFVKENNSLIGVSDAEADSLKVLADYTNPNGYLSFAHLEQRINGIPVFRSEVKAGFTKSGEMIRVINNLAPGLDYDSLSADFRSPLDAVRSAARHINNDTTKLDLTLNETESTDLAAVFGRGDSATTAEKMYFPTEPGVAVPAWRVLIWQPVNAYYVIVDNEGRMLWRKNITEDQTQSATYNVYNNANGFINASDSPAAFSPGPTDPTTGTQGLNGTRSNVTLIGNEGPYSFNNSGWITDGANSTDGNYNEAGIDRVAPDGVDAPQPGDSACPGAGCRVFTSTWNPPPGVPAPGDDPLTAQAQRGAVIQMFYVMNRYQSEMYRLGFTEQSFNFQNDNFGRGGVANDRVRSEGQDSSGTNNANMSTPADGGRGRMQMFLWTGPTPDYDGTPDAEVVIHEVTHGLSNRLHGNAAGLSTNMARGMGEGWSDFYSYTMLAEPSDSINGIYTTGGYATYLIAAGFTANYYYGIRRFPRAPMTFVGANGRPHNPFTFRYVNAGCASIIDGSTSAFPRGPIGSATCDQVHNIGEVWSSMLWEVRTRMVQRLGFAAGTNRVLQVVTDGMKLAPVGPTILQERDAIIAAASALPVAPEAAADVLDVREGFRVRGAGFSSVVNNAGTGANNTVVTEAFDNADVAPGTGTVTSGNNLLEPNECNTLNVPITNNSGNPAAGITAVLTSNTPGITVTQANSAYPNLAGGEGPVNNTTPYQVSVDNTVACFTQASFTLTVTFTGGGGNSPVASNFSLPIGIPGNAYVFAPSTGTIPAGGVLVAGSQADDAAVTIPLPSGWTSSIYDAAVTSLSASTNGLITANGATSTAFTNATLPAAVGTTNPTLAPLWDDMIMTAANVTDGGIYVNTIGTAPNRQLVIEWRAQHFAESVNGPITINIAAVLFEGSSNIRYVYTSTGIAPNANGVSATVGVQRAASSPTFTLHSFNQAVITPGLQLDGTLPAGQCTPGTGPCGPVKPTGNGRGDFDGDGRTDLAVHRASDGNWYALRSGDDSFYAVNWGLGSDTLVPADYDGDGKTDTAIYRPDANPAAADFYILNSNGFTITGIAWGLPGDLPAVGDYDNDGKADWAIYRPSEGNWYILRSNGGFVIVNNPGTTPVPADYNGDGADDAIIFTNGQWTGTLSGGGPVNIAHGQAGDIPVAGDYDGDGTADQAVFRPSTGQWLVRQSSNGQVTIANWGVSTDIPVPGDYDGDGEDDYAIYRPSSGQWWIDRSTSGVIVRQFGLSTDRPIPRFANP